MVGCADRIDLMKALHNRIGFLHREIRRRKTNLRKAPAGTLYLYRINGHVRFYYRSDSDGRRRYLGRGQMDLVRKLAQRDYDRKVISAAECELQQEEDLLLFLNERSADDLFGSLPSDRRRLVDPMFPDPKEYAEEWLSVTYQKRDIYGSEHLTEKGERVRSKSEVLIANELYASGVPYRYEYPIYMDGMGNVHPDFLVLNLHTGQELIWEHFGIMDDPEYAETAVRRLDVYEENGYFPGEKLIVTMETREKPLNIRVIKRMIEHYLT